ncbi:hypothetical protein B9T16_15945 [Arthrospira sp. PCC 8006]
MRMVRSALLIFNQGVEVPTRRLFQVFQPYFMPERLALLLFTVAMIALRCSLHPFASRSLSYWPKFILSAGWREPFYIPKVWRWGFNPVPRN